MKTRKRPLSVSKSLATSFAHAMIALSLALSIFTFVFSLLEFLPERPDTLVKHESLHYNSFLCVVAPLVIAYCTQSKVVAALSQRWLFLRRCLAPDCLDESSAPQRLLHVLNLVGQATGASCSAAALRIFDGSQTVSGQANGSTVGNGAATHSI